jgi:acyl-coenzyme A thioesterase PaaI-like protein
MNETPLQDQLPADHPARVCFGCGADNTHGLQIKSRFQDGVLVCRFTPKEEHTAFPGILNGGIIATLLDCHGIWTAVDHYNRRHGLLETDAGTMFVTKKMTVEYHKPTPLQRELLIEGRVMEEGTSSMQVRVELKDGGQTTASAEIVAVRVKGRD